MGKMRTFLLFLGCTFSSFLFCSCGAEPVEPSRVEVSSVYFELDKTTLNVGETALIQNIQVNPKNATNNSIHFIALNENVISIQGTAVKALNYGSTFVCCVSDDNPDITYKVKVDVVEMHIESVSLFLDRNSIEVEESCNATVSFSPSTALNKDYELVASPSSYVKIEGDKITGLKAGLVSIKAKSLDGGVESQPVNLQVNNITAKGIVLNCEKTSILVGESSSLSYEIKPEDVIDKEVMFKTESGTNNVISISDKGVVTGTGFGEDYAIVYMKNKPQVFNKVKFTVIAIPVTKIEASASKTEIEAMETVQISVEFTPSNATNKDVSYTTKSGKTDIIKVSKTGIVTGVYPGEDYVVCYLTGDPSVKDEIKFVVKETPAGDISIKENKVTAYVDEPYQINAKVLPENAIDKSLSYSLIDRNDYLDKGERFEASKDYTLDLEKPFLLNDIINIDIWFDKDDSPQKISLMLGQRWNSYFGYYDIFSNGTLDTNYQGVSVTEPVEGMFRFSFDLSELDKQNDKPLPTEFIDLVYIRGSYSYASGSIKVNRNIKNNILNITDNGEVTPIALGTQKVKVYLTNHPSISEEILFEVLSNPNDPIGDDIYDIFGEVNA